MSRKLLNSRPIKMWIDGKVFNIRKFKNISSSNKCIEGDNDEENKKLLEIKEENGRFCASFRLPKLYFTKMESLPQFDISKISEDTETEILYPSAEDGEISFKSDNVQQLIQAINHIHAAVAEVRERNMAMQFVCIPCLNKNVQTNFENLKQELLEMESEILGMHESIFMCPKKLHVTIDVYSLMDDREQAEAIKALNDYKTEMEKVLEKTGPIKLGIRGLSCMNNNARKVDVLYANVKMMNETEEHNLQNIVNDISKHFFDRGLARKYQDNVKIHMTVINTKYRRQNGTPKRKLRYKRQSIDATKILEKYKNYDFGHCNFDSLHLSHITLKGEDGFYKPIAIVNLEPNKEI
ncbi:hypothetical protein GWI33_001245 [Rhynchophorus ferrugineus]|uniref:A-kinase anchor protein 7-like phosphoesterase domain-containing protein n=1 Tax=Rhynchophorus ferrugineus TaxID=354439 RepID=A0A834IZA9_RHYFE|nr:hypothetical protein GWI33_001245 [Rhynchophorus ferrugineus]